MRKISLKTRKIVAATSVVAVLATVLLLFILWPDTIVYANELFFFSILAVIIPSAILDYENQRWLEAIEDQMPLLVRGVAESQETGLTLIKAFEKVVDNRMVGRPLADEVRKITVQMSWGTSFEDALTNFKENINSPIVNRFCALVLEASRSGGTIKKVFTATSGFMEEMKEIDKETSAQMKPYVVIVYAAFFVFIVTSILLVQSFFAPMQGAPQIMNQVSIGSISGFKDFFYRDMLVSAVTGGLMAGKLGERRVAGGLKHAIILSVVGYVLFFFTIPPNWMGG
ncbi:MAG: type II secretion system F family protein [Candidatus Bathyarchaeota archaeon]|nr:type II secretion system F family protein [Candidatus Bathyarchaeota archaeon]